MEAIRGPEFEHAVEDKFGMDLSRAPYHGDGARPKPGRRDGQIHTDSRTKLITVLIY